MSNAHAMIQAQSFAVQQAWMLDLDARQTADRVLKLYQATAPDFPA
jgi:hypothetical protein